MNEYDRVRYPSVVFAKTHPAVLSAFAALFGKPYAPVETARVLEIGCGDGVNLINMALGAPGAAFVGVDLAEQPIGRAKEMAQALGLANASFYVQDVATMGAAFGRFDYIIAHGVYAWTPPSVGEALIRAIGASLNENGLAFVSYNTFPGARLRQVLRDMLLSATDHIADPEEKVDVARSILDDAAKTWADDNPLRSALSTLAKAMIEKPPAALYHDELSHWYEPKLLSEAVAAARSAGLDYLCDTQAELCAEAFFPTERYAAAQAHARGDWARFEQITDFNEIRFFRNSIFCRGGGIDRRLEPQRLRGLFAYGELTPLPHDPQAPDSFAFKTDKGAEMTTNSPRLAELLTKIGATFPACVSLDEAAEDEDYAAFVLRLFVNKCIRLRTAPFPFTVTPGERPIASPLVRLQAERGDRIVTSLRHIAVLFEDPSDRALMAMLDGSRTREDLAREVATRQGLSPEAAFAQASKAIETMTTLGLMTA
jgi:SAM-dependent methyltransferase